jgi:hypothetical protein
MLKKNPRLAEVKGAVTDLSGRPFENITGFQYALWSLDWSMWTMLLKYLPPEKAASQLSELERNGTQHGPHFSFEPLLGTLDTYRKQHEPLYKAKRYEEMDRLWNTGVGSEQRQLPSHVINEYCRQDRAFHPTPDFSDPRLPRSMRVGNSFWFTAKYQDKPLGEGFAIYRGSRQKLVCPGRDVYGWDYEAIAALSKTRLAQLAELKHQLLQVQSPQAVAAVG